MIKGAGRSYINATVRPAAGILGVVAHPANGLYRSAQKLLRPATEDVLLAPRRELSIQAFRDSSHEERARILNSYRELEKKTGERRAVLEKQAKEWLKAAREEQKEAEKRGQAEEEEEGGEVVETKMAADSTAEQSETSSDTQYQPIDELSQAEQRGYERALREMQLKKDQQAK